MNRCATIKPLGKESKGFIRNNIYVILAFLIPAAIMTIVFAVSKIYPFGDRMIMVVDSWHQYYPFLEEYQRLLKEGSSLMYSWNIGGGANFLGIVANYLGSPLYLLSAFIPSGTPWLPAFLAGTVVFRIGVAGMSFAIFLRKGFRRNDLSLVTFSLMYAFCAYILGYYWNMMWLDTVALMPLVIAGTIGVLRDKKFSLYIISLALSVICSFYIGYMVCVFVLIVSIGYTIISFVSLKESIKNAGRMLLYTGVALLLTAAVTVPVYMALGVSDSAGEIGGFPTEYTINYAYGYEENSLVNTLMAIVRTATNMLAYTRPIVFRGGLPNIACGVLSLVLVFFYITNRKIGRKEKIVSLSVCAFILLSFVVNQLNFIWHGFATPAMVYYRFSFIFSFAVLVLAYRAYTLIDTVSKKNFFVASGLFFVYLAAAFFLHKKLSVAITFAGAVVILLGIVLYRKRKLRKKVFALLLCLFVVCEMGLSAYLGARTVYSTPVEGYPRNEKEVNELLSLSREDSTDELVRTEFLKSQTLNDAALNSVYGITTFNSMVNSTYTDTFTDIGLAASVGNNRYEYLENTPVVNLLFNIKHVIGRNGEEAHSKYLKPVATTDECTLYENTAYVPSGYMTSTALLEEFESDTGWNNSLTVQDEWFKKLTGTQEDVYKNIEPLSEITCEYMDLISMYKDYKHCYNVDLTDVKAPEKAEKTTEDTGKVSTTDTKISTSDEEALPMIVEYEIPEDGEYYGYFRSTTREKGYITHSNAKDNPREISTKYGGTTALGSFKKGDKIEIVLNAAYGKKTRVAYYVAKLEEDVFAQGIETLRANAMVLSERTDRGLKGTINVSKSGLFLTSVLYDTGWKAYVDGKEVEITPVKDTFIAFELSEGEHIVEFKFTSQGFCGGLVISLAGLMVFMLLCCIAGRKKHKPTQRQIVREYSDAEEALGSYETKSCTDTDT